MREKNRHRFFIVQQYVRCRLAKCVSGLWPKVTLVFLAVIIAATGVLPSASAQNAVPAHVDSALVISIDVSSSLNERRYTLQLEGIASALEDKAVVDTVLNGPLGVILVSVVTWSDRARLAIPWTPIAGIGDARRVAARIRRIVQQEGQYTCVAGMMRYVADKVLMGVPARTHKKIIDVSGDGPDNCNSGGLLEFTRKELIAGGVTINGLPILEGKHADTLEDWYRENVIGGSASFILPADGYADFARAFRQKFIVEISSAPAGARSLASVRD